MTLTSILFYTAAEALWPVVHVPPQPTAIEMLAKPYVATWAVQWEP